ncbi:MAG: cyclic nucleotide-binding protein [Nocardioides sp.]|nr:cyclic nucleotide-binding protein [Nocardioides sp.]
MSNAPRDPEQLLAGTDLFSGLSGRQVRKLVGLGRQVDYVSGHDVAEEGKGALGFHLVLSGDATVTLGDKPVRELHAGDYFGEISMIDGRARSATVTASTALSTFVISHEVFDKLVSQEPEFARGLLNVLCARLRQAEARA